jgi:hypothetical protein
LASYDWVFITVPLVAAPPPLQQVSFKGVRSNKRRAHVRKTLSWSNFNNV